MGDVGVCIDADDRRAEIGFTLARQFQGQGYATEAVRCLIDTLFSSLGLHRISANIDPENFASAKLLQRVGMRHEGRFIESLWLKGHWVNEDWYAILRREWINPDPNFPGITYRRGASGWVIPVLLGTGIRVQTVAVDTQAGMTPEQIASEYDLPVDRIHEARAFYNAHRPEIDANIRVEQEMK